MTTAHTSWRERFLDLTEELFRHLHLESPSRVQQPDLPLTVCIEDVSGEQAEITHPPFPGPNRVVVEMRCSPIGSARSEALEALLRMQHRLDPAQGMSFALDPDAEDVILMQCMGLQDLTAAELWRRLQDMAERVIEMREANWLHPRGDGIAPPDFRQLA